MQAANTIHDVIGVGFGPSNLAFAIALEEARAQGKTSISPLFIEKQPEFVWHGGMLLPDSTMQISFLKDLVLLRNPSSTFTFVNYLHEKGRLEDFINLKTFYPTRVEFNDYFRWGASRFEDRVAYGEEVIGIEPGISGGNVSHLVVASQTQAGDIRHRLARNLVMALGGRPYIPEVFAQVPSGKNLFHSSAFLRAVPALGLKDTPDTRIAVVGGGQSAAEITLDLHQRFSHARIDLICRSTTLKPSDSTPFVNEIFNPQYTDFIFHQPADARESLLGEFRNTNYAVVDEALIEDLYRLHYQQKISGDDRFCFLPMHEIERVRSSGIIELSVVNTVTRTNWLRHYDAVVLATGYLRDTGARMLEGVQKYILDQSLARNYRVQTTSDFQSAIYLQGYSENTHGLSDTLLSVLAVRVQEICDDLAKSKKERQSAA